MYVHLHLVVERLKVFRVFIAALGLSISILIMPFYVFRKGVADFNVWLDYTLWHIALCTLLSTYIDLAVFSRGYSLISTLLLDIIAFLLTVVSRFSSWLYAETVTSFDTPPIGGCIVDLTSLYIAMPIPFASLLTFTATVLHTVRREPVVFRESIDLITAKTIFEQRVRAVICSRWVPLLASFTAGFLVRLYPELLAGSLPVGWDTWEYMAMAKQFTSKLNPFACYIWLGSCRNVPPLLTVLMGIPAFLTDPFIVAKLYPAIAMGLLALFSSAITMKIGGNGVLALVAGLITAFNPYVVGQSQQWFRHVLGVATLLYYIYVCEKQLPSETRVVTLVFAALSYELSATVALLVSIYELAAAKRSRDKVAFLGSVLISLLLLLYYMGFPAKPIATVTPAGIVATGVATYRYTNVLIYTFTWLLVLVPNLVSLAIYKQLSWQYRIASSTILLISLTPLIVQPAPSDQHRWFTLFLTLSTPITCLALHRLGKRVLAIYTAVVVLAGYAYIFTPAGYEAVNIWRSTIPHAHGFPWRMSPAIEVEDLQIYHNLSKIVAEYNNATTLISLVKYPILHYHTPQAENIVITPGEPSILTIVHYMNETKLWRIIAITEVDLVEQRSEILNTTSKELFREYIEIVKDVNLTRLNPVAYIIELSTTHTREENSVYS